MRAGPGRTGELCHNCGPRRRSPGIRLAAVLYCLDHSQAVRLPGISAAQSNAGLLYIVIAAGTTALCVVVYYIHIHFFL
jgi:hypothetical protein